MSQEMKEILKEMMKKPKEFHAAIREIRLERIKELQKQRSEQWQQRKQKQEKAQKKS